MRYVYGCILTCSLFVLGCSTIRSAIEAPVSPASQAALAGHLRGGQQPIAGAHVYLLAANHGGNGGPGVVASPSIASISLLDPARTGGADGIGAYVLSDGQGAFSLNGMYACTPGQQVYLYALGGNPGAGSNGAASLLAILGQCPQDGNFAGSVPFISVNEVTTIAAAYAMAGFATDATHVSASSTPLAKAGLASAFAHAANLARISDGTPVAPTSGTRDAVALATINTLADVLAACVNSAGNSGTCGTLFSNAGSSSRAAAMDTATAAIYLAQNSSPGQQQMSALFGLLGSTAPFQPVLSAQPANFSITQSLSAKSYSSLGDSITCGYVGGQALTDCSTSFAYPSTLASDYNLSLTNPAYSGDQACDLWPVQIGPYALSPSLANGPELYTLMIGTNDVDIKGAGAYESTFKLCDSAAVAWLAIPLETKTLAAAASLGTGWTQASSRQLGPYATSSTPGSVATFSLPTYGGPIMLWYVVQDASAGELSYSIDGGAPTLLSTQPSPAMSTQNGGSVSVALALTSPRLTSVMADGVHTIAITNVSGVTQVIGVGTPPMTSFFGQPVLGIADVPNDGPGGPVNASTAAAYSADAQSIATLMQGYGLDVRFGSTHSYLVGDASEFQYDLVHPNSLGALHLAQGLENILQPS